MSTNPTPLQTAYQRKHRNKKREQGLCAENGCGNLSSHYRCQDCAKLHAEKEARRRDGQSVGHVSRDICG